MNDGASSLPKSNAKRCTEFKLQSASCFSKRHKKCKKGVEKSVIASEELVAQIHPNEIINAKQVAGEDEVRGWKCKDRPQKWNDEEEVCIAMALLESCPPGGKVNKVAYCQRAKAELGFEVSNDRLLSKMKRMRKRFRDIQNKLKEQNIEEADFTFRTPHEPALFLMWKQIWGQNNDFLQAECGKLYLGDDNVAENSDSDEVEIINPNYGKVDLGKTNSGEIDPDPNIKEIEPEIPIPVEVVVWNSKTRVIEAEKVNPGKIGDEITNYRILEAGNANSESYDAENISSDKFVNSNNNQIEGSNPKEGDAGTIPTACGDRTEVQHNYKQQEEDEEKNGATEWQSLQGSPSKESETDYVSEHGGHQSPQLESRYWEGKIECMIHNIESRLEGVIKNSVSHALHAAKLQTFGGFEAELGMGTCGHVTRRMNEVIDRVDFFEQLHGVDSAEVQELQKKWRKINIQKTKIFSEHLELLKDQCKWFLKIVEQKRPQECPYQEILSQNQIPNGLRQCENRSLENNIQRMMEKTESKLEAASCINTAFSFSFQPSRGFRSIAETGSHVISHLSRRMQELMDDVNSVEEFPYGDVIESSELQQKWRKFKIQKVEMFAGNLELLNDESKLLLRSVEKLNGCHRS